MFLFTEPLYELLAAEVLRACFEASPREQVVEINRRGKEMLFRFTAERSAWGEVRLWQWRMLTWCDGRLESNDFDVEILKHFLV